MFGSKISSTKLLGHHFRALNALSHTGAQIHKHSHTQESEFERLGISFPYLEGTGGRDGRRRLLGGTLVRSWSCEA